MKKGAGKKSSPLDDIRPERWTSRFTTELLELLGVLEATIAGYPEQATPLKAVVAGEWFKPEEPPKVSAQQRRQLRKPPGARPKKPSPSWQHPSCVSRPATSTEPSPDSHK